MEHFTFCSKHIKVTAEDISHLQSLSGYQISYLAHSILFGTSTHVNENPIGNRLSTHVTLI